MIKSHDRKGITDYFKELGMEIRTSSWNQSYTDMICYPNVDNHGSIHLYEIAHLKNEKLYKLNKIVLRYDAHGVYWLAEEEKPNTVVFGKVSEKDCNSIVNSFIFKLKEAKKNFLKDKIERICREEDRC